MPEGCKGLASNLCHQVIDEGHDIAGQGSDRNARLSEIHKRFVPITRWNRTSQPGRNASQRAFIKSVVAVLPFFARHHNTCFAQHLQVLRHRGLRNS